MLCRKGNDPIAIKRSPAHRHDQPAVWRARECRDYTFGFGHIIGHIKSVDWLQFHPERRCYGLDHGELADPRASRGIPNDRRPRYMGRDLLEQLQPFSSEAVIKLGKSDDVAAGS